MGGSDKRLTRRATRGDTGAFEEIYRRYGQDLYRFCLAMTSNPQDAQDALQNTMVKVLRALPGEERQIVLRPWLYRIARNETVDVLRKRGDSEQLGDHEVAMGTVAETAEIRESLRTLLSDLEQLPQRQRTVLLMRELSGLDFAEIAAAFGTSAGAIRQTLYEARLSLQQLQEGRERLCADVQRELSDADGRVIRRRKTRAHLRDCPECLAFYNEISSRQENLAAIAALPLALFAGLVRNTLGGHAGSIAGGAGTGAAGSALGPVTTGLGNTIMVSAVTKSTATLAVAALAVSAAGRGGLIDLPLRGKGDSAAIAGSATTGAEAGSTGPSGGSGAGGPVEKPDREAGAQNGSELLAGSPSSQPTAGPSQAGSDRAASDGHQLRADSGSPGAEGSEGAATPQSPGSQRADSGAAQGGSPPATPQPTTNGQETAAAKAPPQAGGSPAPPGIPQSPAAKPEAPPESSAKPEAPPGNPAAAPGNQGSPPGQSAAQADPPRGPPDSPGNSGDKGAPPNPG